MASAIAYGVIHDQFTARISIEYFTVGHPRLFLHDSPTLHGAAWGVLATWWVGLLLGLALSSAARLGSRPKLSLKQVAPLIAWVVGISGIAALLAGMVSWVLVSADTIHLSPHWAARVSLEQQRGFLIDSWVHTASYAAGAIAGLGVCLQAWRMRASSQPPYNKALNADVE